jgi:hypothetical protein
VFAAPLLLGIFLALAMAAADSKGYDYWCGASHGGGGDGDDDAHRFRALSAAEDDDHGGEAHPTLFGLSIHGHDVTLHFLVNDVLMCVFFGLATKEIAEAVQPGGSLYPPGVKAVSPLAATVGGVVSPIAFYLVLLQIFAALGLLNDEYSMTTYAQGWGIPTATDISLAWATAFLVFGANNPAIDYLLLLAVVDDGIGLVIIACFYGDPEKVSWWFGVGVALSRACGLERRSAAGGVVHRPPAVAGRSPGAPRDR